MVIRTMKGNGVVIRTMRGYWGGYKNNEGVVGWLQEQGRGSRVFIRTMRG